MCSVVKKKIQRCKQVFYLIIFLHDLKNLYESIMYFDLSPFFFFSASVALNGG